MDVEGIKDVALHDIDTILREKGRSLNDYPPMPIPTSIYAGCQSNVLMMEELKYNTYDMQRQYESLIP